MRFSVAVSHGSPHRALSGSSAGLSERPQSDEAVKDSGTQLS